MPFYNNPRLYAGYRSSSLNLYQAEITKAVNVNPTLQVFDIYQDIKGMLDINTIFEQNKTGATYFISGPPVMIKTFKQTLITKGVPASQVLTDDWE